MSAPTKTTGTKKSDKSSLISMKGKPKRSRAEIEAEVRRHVKAEEIAYRWVERLAVEDRISEIEMVEMVNAILPTHYHDIIEERSISKVCGYPLCSNKLEKISKQKFHISMQTNQIYDMSERKCFCSNKCYKSSKYIEIQIPESPLWLRKEKIAVNFNLNADQNIKIKEQTIDVSHFRKLELEDIENEKNTEDIGIEDDYANSSYYMRQTVVMTKGADDSKKEQTVSKDKPKEIDIIQLFKEWLTPEAMMYFSGKNEPEKQQIVRNKDHKKSQISDAKGDEADSLSEDLEGLKVEENKKPVNQIPLIDSKAQNAIRRKIVKERVHARLTKLLHVLALTPQDVHSDVFAAIDLLRLTSENVSLPSKQWTIAALIFLKLLCTRNTSVQTAFDERRSELEEHLENSHVITLNQLEETVQKLYLDVPELLPQPVACNEKEIPELCIFGGDDDDDDDESSENEVYSDMEELD